MQIQDDAEAEAPEQPDERVAIRFVAVVDGMPAQYHNNQNHRQDQHRRSSANATTQAWLISLCILQTVP